MKTLSLKSSVKITRALLAMAALSAPLAVHAGVRNSVSALEKNLHMHASAWAGEASAKWTAFLSEKSTVNPKACAYVNGWLLPDNPVVGQGYPITWTGYSSAYSYVMLYTKPPGGTWRPCGSGGVPPGGGLVNASGSFGITASGVWQFAVAPGGSPPTVVSATLTVP